MFSCWVYRLGLKLKVGLKSVDLLEVRVSGWGEWLTVSDWG